MNDNLFLREAVSEDLDLLFKWANDQETRRNSFDSHTITIEEHTAWFKKMMKDENQVQYILMDREKPVGQIRMCIDGTSAELSCSISPAERGYGYGKEIFRLLIIKVQAEYPLIEKLISNVKPSNVASYLCLSKNGFEEEYRHMEYDFKTHTAPCVSENMVAEGSGNIKRGGVILYLTNNKNTLGLFDWISKRCDVEIYSNRLTIEYLDTVKPDLVISYNYSYLISKECIDFVKGRMINMHISFLPWNRGSSPNIWSFVEDTPKGVTIHMISEGLDEGDILFQKEIEFDPRMESFQTTHAKLNEEIAALFKDNWDTIISGDYLKLGKKQPVGGSYHSIADLKRLQKEIPFEWKDNIEAFLQRYRRIKSQKHLCF